jgi:hypothetical protein
VIDTNIISTQIKRYQKKEVQNPGIEASLAGPPPRQAISSRFINEHSSQVCTTICIENCSDCGPTDTAGKFHINRKTHIRLGIEQATPKT